MTATFESDPAARMAAAGICQRGESILEEPTVDFDLPADRASAEALGRQLIGKLDEVRQLHDFSGGCGLSAPQIGVGLSAAVVQLPNASPRVLFNPRMLVSSEERSVDWEGCLSFFDVRGLVPRAVAIVVEHADLEGNRAVVTFDHEAARMWAHEIDHLNGVLYTERMLAGSSPLAVAEYRQIKEAGA